MEIEDSACRAVRSVVVSYDPQVALSNTDLLLVLADHWLQASSIIHVVPLPKLYMHAVAWLPPPPRPRNGGERVKEAFRYWKKKWSAS